MNVELVGNTRRTIVDLGDRLYFYVPLEDLEKEVLGKDPSLPWAWRIQIDTGYAKLEQDHRDEQDLRYGF